MYHIRYSLYTVVLRFRGKNEQFQQKASDFRNEYSNDFGESEARNVNSSSPDYSRLTMKVD